ncbi:MAG TPA: YdeI/OmpD-associated family protein [Anaerolineales bacterium]|nr:YdeI/OmpD-associated family protein [Anaerolineales bacterium]
MSSAQPMHTFSATVVRFRGMWRLYLNTAMREAARIKVGGSVRIEVEFDSTPRTVPAPRKFTLALSKNRRAREAFEKLAPSRQKEILRYLNSLKRAETLERNIEKIIQSLQGEEV